MAFRVFVGNLPENIEGKTFDEEIKKLTGCASTEFVSNKKRPHGFAIFDKLEDAKKAIEIANGKMLNDKPIKVQMARTPAECKLLVSNLSPNMQDADLRQIFENNKNIVRSSLKMKDGKCTGKGILVFSTKEQAEAAMKDAAGTKVDDKEIIIKIANRKKNDKPKRKAKKATPKEPAQREKDSKMVYVGNLSFSTTKEDLMKLFADNAPKNAEIKTYSSGRSRGFGFVEFETEEAATKSLEKNNTDFMERKIRCDIAYKRIEREKETKIVFVANLAFSAKKEDLMKLFADNAPKNAEIRTYSSGRSRGFGFVEFETEEAATKSLEKNNTDFMERKIRCSYCLQEISECY